MDETTEIIDEGMTLTLEQELIADLTDKLEDEELFSQKLLISEIRGAIRAMKSARMYQNNPQRYTDEVIEKDLYNYYDNIRGLASDRYSKIGTEGESSHSENGVSRVYESEKRWFAGVLPIAKIV
jgi:hypothetical protein